MVKEDVVNDRSYYNRLILQMLTIYLRENPQIRFHQALQNIGINMREQGDRFYEESEETYFKIIKR